MGRNQASFKADFRARVAAHAKALVERGVSNWQRETAAEFGIYRETVGKWFRAAYPDADTASAAVATDPAPPETTQSTEQTEAGDDLTVTLRNTPVSTPEALMREAGVDPDEWELVAFTKKTSQSLYAPRAVRATDSVGWTRVPGNEHARVVTLYHVSAKFRRKVAVITARAEIEALLATARAGISLPPLPVRAPIGKDLLLELGPLDHHVGKLAWPKETGDDPYDVDIAVETYRQAVRTLIERSGHRSYERALFLVGQDMMHVAGMNNATVAGTPQDVDGRFPRIFRYTWQMVVEAIRYVLAEVGPVTALAIQGNHDGPWALAVADVVSAYFHDQPHVTVRAAPKPRKYEEWGANLLGFTHLDGIKAEQLYRLMSQEQPEAWARTRFREWHVGHPHTQRMYVDEINGVRVRCLSSLTPADDWHARKGLVGNVRASEAFQWHKAEGLIGTAAYSVLPVLESAA